MAMTLRTLKDVEIAFPNQGVCLVYLEKLRWNNIVVSPFDLESPVKKEYSHHYYCRTTRKRFTVLTGTIFSGTKAPLQDWFKVIWLYQIMPGISTIKAEALTGVKQKTVWSMKKRFDLTQSIKEV